MSRRVQWEWFDHTKDRWVAANSLITFGLGVLRRKTLRASYNGGPARTPAEWLKLLWVDGESSNLEGMGEAYEVLRDLLGGGPMTDDTGVHCGTATGRIDVSVCRECRSEDVALSECAECGGGDIARGWRECPGCPDCEHYDTSSGRAVRMPTPGWSPTVGHPEDCACEGCISGALRAADTGQGDGVMSPEELVYAIDLLSGASEHHDIDAALRERRQIVVHDAALRARLTAAEAAKIGALVRAAEAEERVAELEWALRDLVEKCKPVLDNADGYDKSNFRGCILDATRDTGRAGAWSRDELLKVESDARFAYKQAKRALSGKGENDE